MSSLTSRMGFPEELRATMTGSFVKIGSVAFAPAVIGFSNESETEAIQISIDGSTVWKTFQPGEAFVLDCSTNKGSAPDLNPNKGTTFFGNGASGDFSIWYVYHKS